MNFVASVWSSILYCEMWFLGFCFQSGDKHYSCCGKFRGLSREWRPVSLVIDGILFMVGGVLEIITYLSLSITGFLWVSCYVYKTIYSYFIFIFFYFIVLLHDLFFSSRKNNMRSSFCDFLKHNKNRSKTSSLGIPSLLKIVFHAYLQNFLRVFLNFCREFISL